MHLHDRKSIVLKTLYKKIIEICVSWAQFCQSCLSLSLSVFSISAVATIVELVLGSYRSALLGVQYFCDGPSSPSSVLGMSNISANNGGSRM